MVAHDPGVQFEQLNSLLDELAVSNQFYQQKFRDHTGRPVQSLSDLQELPFTTKQELAEDQAAHPPYGTNLTYPLEKYCRIHQTSGTKGQPMRWMDTSESWQWIMGCWEQIYDFIGLRESDRLFFPFSFGPFIGFWAAFEGAARMGNLCMPGGGMSSAARLRFLLDNEATIVCCTPTYALRLVEAARQEGIGLEDSAVRGLVVAGEPGGSIGATRTRIEQSWAARVFDHWGMTEIGSLGVECEANPGGFHLLEGDCIPEVLDFSGDKPCPVSLGEEGELVITNLGRRGSPLVRYRTGDRVVVDPDPCPCGSPFMRLKGGILGRADDMIFIRGNNVYPSNLEAIVRKFPEIDEFLIRVEDGPSLPSVCIQVECSESSESIPDCLRAAIRDKYHFGVQVEHVSPGTLPRAEMKSRRFVRKIKQT